MSALHDGYNAPRSSVLATLTALMLPVGPALAQDVKVPPTPFAVEDVKTAWVPPIKADAPSRPIDASGTQVEPSASPALPDELAGFAAPSFSDRVMFDRPGDGSLWARGANYKVRFDGQGVTYIPFLGSSAPRNYPVTFSLQSVTVGDVDVELASSAADRYGDTVVIDRGGLVEIYELRPDSMEQLFQFHAFPASGEIVVSLAVETDLAAEERAEGFRFSNERGWVDYSRAVVLDAAGRSEPARTTLVDGRIEIRVEAGFLEEAAFPVTIDPVVSTFNVDQGQGVDTRDPDIAFDGTWLRFCVVWEQVWSANDHDVYSVLLYSHGGMVPNSETAIDFTTECWVRPRVANNQIADQFLAVAQVSTGVCSGADARIMGRTRQAPNNGMGPQIQISGGFIGSKVNPDVGGDPVNVGPTYYCVVWERIRNSNDRDIHYQLVRSDSTLLFSSTHYIDNSGPNIDSFPVVSKSNGQLPFASQEWTVVWRRRFSSGDHDLYGAQIRWDGSITNEPFLVDGSSNDDHTPHVSTILSGGSGPRPYMVVWQRILGNGPDVAGRVLAGANAITGSVNLTALEAGNHQGLSQYWPAVDSDGVCFAVVTQEDGGSNDDIFVSTFRLAASTIVPIETHHAFALSGDSEYEPQSTSFQSGSDGPQEVPNRFGSVWYDYDSGSAIGDIEGGLYDAVCHPGVGVCFGDGSGDPCPCGNTGQPGAGCANTSGVGCTLTGSGTNSLLAADLILQASDALPFQPGVFFQGDNLIDGGDGDAFGDGLRCAGVNVIRLEVVLPDGSGNASSSIDLGQAGNASAGDFRRYQYWYRDPAGGGVCGSGFNLSNAYEVYWAL